LKIQTVHTEKDLKSFLNVSRFIYKAHKYYRRSNEDIVALLFRDKTAFRNHAKIQAFIITSGVDVVGRFCLINDLKNKDICMVAFFEALPDISNLASEILCLAKAQFPNCKKLLIGLDGHLNYGAGILLDNFENKSSYGLPYTPPYYPNYFKDYACHHLLTFKFPIIDVESFHENAFSRLKNITVRSINKNNLADEVKIYTALNNKCFRNHIYWTDRAWEEDFEIFDSFKHLIENENLLFAEFMGQPIGFLLWFPDFNQMLNPDSLLKASTPFSKDVLRFKYFNPIKNIRLAEIAVIPEFQNKLVDLLLLKTMFKEAYKRGYKECEGGFISETNKNSLNLAFRYIERITQTKVTPYRTYGVFEKKL